MMDELQQAISLAEAGNSKEAQVRLARFLKGNPDSVDGWLALSRVINDRDKKRIFLKKALALDPLHQVARTQLTALEQRMVTPDMPTVIETSRPEAPAEFVAADALPVAPSAAATQVVVKAAAPADAAADGIPPWQQAGDAAAWPAGEDGDADAPQPAGDMSKAAPFTQPGVDPEPPADGKAIAETPQTGGRTDWVLVGLGGLAIIVGLVLIFLLLQYF